MRPIRGLHWTLTVILTKMLPPSLGNRHCKVMVGLGLPEIILPPYKKYLSESEAKKRCPELRGRERKLLKKSIGMLDLATPKADMLVL